MKMNEFIARLKQQPRIGGVPRINVPAAAAALLHLEQILQLTNKYVNLQLNLQIKL
jgi:hypothetical protein